MSKTASPEARARYWRKNLAWLGGLLAVWFWCPTDAAFCGSMRWTRSRFRGRGSSWDSGLHSREVFMCFVVLIAIYVVVMNKLDKELVGEDSE